MTRTDLAAVPTAVADDRPDRMHLPFPRVGPAQDAAADAHRRPRSVTLALSAAQADELPLCLPGLLAAASLRPGDEVTVDLGGLFRVSTTGLDLLLTVLWRHVGLDGQVRLTGGTPGLRGQLDSVGVCPQACRVSVFGRDAGGTAPAGPAPGAVPSQDRSSPVAVAAGGAR